MNARRRWSAGLVLAACVASLAGVPPVRWLEQVPAPLLLPLERALAGSVRSAQDAPVEGDLQRARNAFEAWLEELAGPVPVAGPGREGLFVPVLAADGERRRLTLRVPADAVPAGAAVTCRGVLLGFAAAHGGEATVELLGSRKNLRTVAGEWRVERSFRPVHFLLEGSDPELRVHHRSSSASPPEGQAAWTRDVSAMGDPLPAGLLLGRVVSATTEQPGGVVLDEDESLRLEPMLDTELLPGWVTVEVRSGSSLPCRVTDAGLLLTAGRTREGQVARRIDRGSRHGVAAGDWVVAEGRFLGRVEVAGPHASVLRFGPPPGSLLVLDEGDGAVTATPCRPDSASWPEGWRPLPGQLVAGGHLAVGGLVLGRVGAVDERGFRLLPPTTPATTRVQVLGW